VAKAATLLQIGMQINKNTQSHR